MDNNLENYKSETDAISQEIHFLKKQYKRENLIIYNLKEEIQESRKELEEKTISLFSNAIKISIDLSQIDIGESVPGLIGTDQFWLVSKQKEPNTLFLEE